MESFFRGWGFLIKAWGLMFTVKDLVKPSLYAVLVNSMIILVGMIPYYFVLKRVGDHQTQRVILFVLTAVFMFAQYTATYVLSGITIHLIFEYLTQGDGRMDKAWSIVKGEIWNIMMLAAISTAVGMLRQSVRRDQSGGLDSLASIATGVLDVLWTEASYLILPAIVIDNLSFENGVKRAAQIIKENLLLIGISTVGVNVVVGIVSSVLLIAGAVIALAILGGVSILVKGIAAVSFLKMVLAALVFFAFWIGICVFSAYTTSAYYACLYLWAREVKRATVMGKSPAQVPAPAPLAAILDL
ncbi:MAG: DUF6159 family protein [Abditibacteriaceae bacterium]